jgi:MoaA/NifB/PqqE/SkfB family radical SAM enzyme
MTIDKTVFCNIPYSSVVINPDGSYRLCSLVNSFDYDMGASLDFNRKEMNVLTHSFEQAINGIHQKDLRKCHLKGEKHSMCSCCYDRDAIDGNSRRTHLMSYLPRISPDFVSPELAATQTNYALKYSGKIQSLDLRFGNLCNLACVTCGPWYSDKWYSDYEAINKTTEFLWNGKTISIKDGNRITGGATPWWETDIWWQRFDSAMPNLLHLYVTAGEPLLVKAFSTMLERLVVAGFASNVILELDTNLTVLNPKILDLWKHFKRVDLRISVDDTEEKYELFRYPGKFSTLDTNIKELLDRNYKNVDILLTSCITPLNVFSIPVIEEYSKDLGVKRGAHFRFVDTPERLDIKKLSVAKKDFIVSYLSDFKHSKWSVKVINYLDQHRNVTSVDAETRFVDTLDKLDILRSHNWRDVFPLTNLLYNIK